MRTVRVLHFGSMKITILVKLIGCNIGIIPSECYPKYFNRSVVIARVAVGTSDGG